MANEKLDSLKPAAEGLQSILERIGEFFHIFDLSFLVSGAVAGAALICLCFKIQAAPRVTVTGWLGVFGVLVASYALGLMCFTLGRSLNGLLFRRKVFPWHFQVALMANPSMAQLAREGEMASYIEDDRKLWWLYLRMWQDLLRYRSKTVAFSHLNRYWVMAGTYDGLAVAFLVWAATVLIASCPAVAPVPIELGWGIGLATMFALLSLAALRQGAAYYRSQIDDLVAAALSAKEPVI